jgi:sRNA-binding protein
VDVELAREVAVRVALEGDDAGTLEGAHGEFDQTH